jgi:hypothetical protein
MPEEIGEGAGDRNDDRIRRETRRREERRWRGGLIAALVFLGLAILYNGIAYRRLARAQQKLTIAMIRQIHRRGHRPIGLLYGPAFGGGPFVLPSPGASSNYPRPDPGSYPGYPNEQEQQQKQIPNGQSTSSQ